MSDFIENLWFQFGVETQEHIEEIELKLVEIEQNGASKDIVGSLFRSFHSLKGLATAMDMSSFARIAHRAEDILGVIRDGEFPLNCDVISLLLAAIDEIKILRQSAVTFHENGDANQQLLEGLVDTFNAIDHHSTPEDTSAPPPLLTALQVDPEMLTYFIELAREKISNISRILEPCCTALAEDLPERSDFAVSAAVEIDQLVYAARTMEFFALATTLEHVRAALPVHSRISALQQGVVTERLRELHTQIRYIEASSGNSDAGGTVLHEILTDIMHTNLQNLFRFVLHLLAMLRQCERDGDELHVAQEIQKTFSTINSHLAFFMFSTSCTIILMLEDVFSRIARGELRLFNEIIDLACDEVHSVIERYRNCSGAGTCLRDNEDISQRLQQLHDYIWAYETGGNLSNPVEVFRHFMVGLNIEPELLKILSPENVRDLMRMLEKGEHIYEVMAHLESNEEMAARFLSWIENSGSRIVTNRSVFIDDKSWYEMLMVSPLSRSDIEKNMAACDPDGLFLALKEFAAEAPEKEALLKVLDTTHTPRQVSVPAADVSTTVIRVHGETLDNFMNLIGEMVLSRSRLNHILSNPQLNRVTAGLRQQAIGGSQEYAELLGLLEEQRRELRECDRLLGNALGRLQESAVGLRVVPVELVFKRLPRVVRDLARVLGKSIRLETEGQETKIDKAMVEILTDPLLHMTRNSIDHGIEMPEARAAAGKPREAVIRVTAVQRGNNIIIEISDDGAGIDTGAVLRKAIERGIVTADKAGMLSREEILNFIFQPGFSTAAAVSETSGRGVGMDVVMTNVMRLGGTISVASEAGHGTLFTLRMPLSAAIQEVLMVVAAGQTLALPGRYVAEVAEIGAEELQTVRGRAAILLRGIFLPLHRLSSLLGFPAQRDLSTKKSSSIAVVLTNGNQSICLEVDAVLRRQELFVKDIQDSIATLPGVGGASILGDGSVVLILDGEDLLRLAKRSTETGSQ